MYSRLRFVFKRLIWPLRAPRQAHQNFPRTYPRTMQGCTICASFDYFILNFCCFCLILQPSRLQFRFPLVFISPFLSFFRSFFFDITLILLLILHAFFPSLLICFSFRDFFIPSSGFSSYHSFLVSCSAIGPQRARYSSRIVCPNP